MNERKGFMAKIKSKRIQEERSSGPVRCSHWPWAEEIHCSLRPGSVNVTVCRSLRVDKLSS